MKLKLSFFLFFLFFLQNILISQNSWNATNLNSSTGRNGNVGIGTLSPIANSALHLELGMNQILLKKANSSNTIGSLDGFNEFNKITSAIVFSTTDVDASVESIFTPSRIEFFTQSTGYASGYSKKWS